MASVALLPVTEVDFRAFTAAFNLAYSDYFVPISMTPSSFRSLIERDDLSLSDSVAALDGGQIVGTGLLGIRGELGWIGGMGVIPERRREGIGRAMMDFLLDRGRARCLTAIDLEVIEENQGAHALYYKLGFQDRRMLLSVERTPGPPPEPDQSLAVREHPAGALLKHYDAFHPVPNAWQRSLRSLELLIAHVESWGAFAGDRLEGYALGWASRHGVRLIDLAARPGAEEVAARALLTHLHRAFPGAPGSIYNIPEGDPTLPAFRALGYEVTLRQFEMRLELS